MDTDLLLEKANKFMGIDSSKPGFDLRNFDLSQSVTYGATLSGTLPADLAASSSFPFVLPSSRPRPDGAEDLESIVEFPEDLIDQMYDHVVARKDVREEEKARTGRKTGRSSQKSAKPVITATAGKEYRRPITAVPALQKAKPPPMTITKEGKKAASRLLDYRKDKKKED